MPAMSLPLVTRQTPGVTTLPSGVVPNYINPPWQGYRVEDVSIALVVIAAMAVTVRLATKRFIVRKLSWDDLFIVLALILALGRTIANCINATKFDLGIHIWDIPPNEVSRIGNYQKNTLYAADMLYLLGIMCTKLSLLLLYLAIFEVKAWFRICCLSTMILVSVYCILFFFLYAFNCSPVEMTWHLIGWTRPGHCMNNIKVNFAIGGFNIATDLIIILLPMPVIGQLHLNLGRKIALLFIFSTGLFVWATTIAREVIVVRTLRNADQTWDTIPEIIWLTVELNVGIVCACLPTFGPLYHRHFVARIVPSYMRSLFTRSTSKFNSRKASAEDFHKKNGESDIELVKSSSSARAAGSSGGYSGYTELSNEISKTTVIDVNHSRQ